MGARSGRRSDIFGLPMIPITMRCFLRRPRRFFRGPSPKDEREAQCVSTGNRFRPVPGLVNWRPGPRAVRPGLRAFALRALCGVRWLRLCRSVLHPFEFVAARDDSAVTLAPEGRQILNLAQCVSTANGVKDRRAPERGGRTGDECFLRPVPGLANLLHGPRARALGFHLFSCARASGTFFWLRLCPSWDRPSSSPAFQSGLLLSLVAI